MPSLDTRGTSSAEGTALETDACWVIAHGWSSAASPWRGTVEARPLRAKTPPSSNPPFSAATSHWAQDRPANGSGGIRRAPVLGVMGAMDGRDGEIAQLWPWRGFDHLVAKRHLPRSRDVYGVSSAWSQWRLHCAVLLASRSPLARSCSSQALTIAHPKCAPRSLPNAISYSSTRIHTPPSRYDCHRYNPSTSSKIWHS